jgi:hypothetical protein
MADIGSTRQSPTTAAGRGQYMASDERTYSSALQFRLTRAELVALLVRLGLPDPDQRSVLMPLIQEARRAGPRNLTAQIDAFADDPDVAGTLAILARPTVIMDNRIGGGAQPLNFFTACHASDIEEDAVATIMPSADGTFLFALHESSRAYLAWWLSNNAARASDPVANDMPSPLELEAAIYILHSIDLYRRRAYDGLLAHETTDRPAITPETFVSSLLHALERRDLRWLAPAFTALTPGLNFDVFSKSEAAIERLARLDVLRAGKGSRENPVLAFGETGRRLGVEFYYSWFKCAGFETLVYTGSEWTTVSRGFLAPTGITNHLFLLRDNDGVCCVQHQPLTRDLLDVKFASMWPDTPSSGAADALRYDGRRGATRQDR